MNIVLLVVAVSFLLLGYYLGRESRRQADARRCPRCRHRRLYWCRGCGVHYDDDDSAIDPREYERMTAVDALFEDEPRAR